MKLKELLPLVGTDEVIILLPQDTVAGEPALANYLEDEGGLERIDTASELGILLRPYHEHIIANLTPESVSYDFRGLRLFANEEARAAVLEMEIESVLTHLAEYERDMLCIVVK
jgi:hypothetical protein